MKLKWKAARLGRCFGKIFPDEVNGIIVELLENIEEQKRMTNMIVKILIIRTTM